MRLHCSVLAVSVLALSALSAQAAPFNFPVYPNIGTPTTTVQITAFASGDIIGTFLSSSAGGDDTVRMYNVTLGTYSPYLLDNHASAVGQTADFGYANAGDVLVFEIHNNDLGPGSNWVYSGGQPNPILSSDAAYSADGVSHSYTLNYPAGTLPGVGPLTYMSFEDLPASISDFDYNDEDIYVTNILTTSTPEPASLALLGSGALCAVGVLRRRRRW